MVYKVATLSIKYSGFLFSTFFCQFFFCFWVKRCFLQNYFSLWTILNRTSVPAMGSSLITAVVRYIRELHWTPIILILNFRLNIGTIPDDKWIAQSRCLTDWVFVVWNVIILLLNGIITSMFKFQKSFYLQKQLFLHKKNSTNFNKECFSQITIKLLTNHWESFFYY